MRLIGHLPAEPDARRFVDYLFTRSIAAHAEENAGGAWELWVEHDDHLDAGRAELQQFQADPAAARFDSADAAATLRKKEEAAAEKRRRNFRDVRTTTFAAPSNAVPATMAIIGIAVALHVVTHFGGDGPAVATLRALLFVDPVVESTENFGSRSTMFYSLMNGQLWRLVTPAFLHGGLLHILFNMMWMLDLGRRIEPMKGSGKFIGLVLLIAALSNFAQAGWYAVTPWNPEHYNVFLGMSGVVAGLFGYAWMCGRYRSYERIGVSQYETGMMLGWLAICSFGFVGPIANAAHWGGLIVGMAIGAGPTLLRKMRT